MRPTYLELKFEFVDVNLIHMYADLVNVCLHDTVIWIFWMVKKKCLSSAVDKHYQ